MKVGIVMGSDSDLPVMREAADVLRDFGIEYEITIASAHRTPQMLQKFVETASQREIKVFIAGAGGAAHLPGVVAAFTTSPVIGVPIQTKSLGGVDSLYSIVQMPSGIPVATVAINGAKNAGILAAQILGVADEKLTEKLKNFRADLANSVEKKAEKLDKIGVENYLNEMT